MEDIFLDKMARAISEQFKDHVGDSQATDLCVPLLKRERERLLWWWSFMLNERWTAVRLFGLVRRAKNALLSQLLALWHNA